MVTHILNAGVRALAASIVLGGILMFAVGGLDSPDARPLAAIIVAGFFIFWIVFVFLFGPRVPKRDPRTQDRDQDDHSPLSPRVRRRESDDGDHGGEVGEARDGDGGGD
jgi:hypothetical protein